MPIILTDSARRDAYAERGIPVIERQEAERQDIRPLRILLLNLMPQFLETELQILRLLANSPLQVELTLLRSLAITRPQAGDDYLFEHRPAFEAVRDSRFDALVLSGTSSSEQPYGELPHWEQVASFLTWAAVRVRTSLFIGWGAEAALVHYHGVLGQFAAEPEVRVVRARTGGSSHPLLRGLDQSLPIPVARSTRFPINQFQGPLGFELLLTSEALGVHLAQHRQSRRLFLFDHLEASAGMFRRQRRQAQRSAPTPRDLEENPQPWRAAAHLLLANWLHSEVYAPLSLPDAAPAHAGAAHRSGSEVS
jgi:homoserine O-succinyltransferase